MVDHHAFSAVSRAHTAHGLFHTCYRCGAVSAGVRCCPQCGTALRRGLSIVVVVVARKADGGLSGTLQSILTQTHIPDQIVVVDLEQTGKVRSTAEQWGVGVLVPAKPLPSGAARKFAIGFLVGDAVVAIEAPGILAPTAVESVLTAFAHPERVDPAACAVIRYAWMAEDGCPREILCALPRVYRPSLNDNGHTELPVTCLAARLAEVRGAGFPGAPPRSQDALRSPGAPGARRRRTVAVIVPAYNEEDHIERTLRSIREQTTPPDRIIVVDDCSHDRTGQIARHLGVEVIRPLRNTGNKASAHNLALPLVTEDIVVNVDGDTSLAPDALQKLLASFDDAAVAAASGAVLPRAPASGWERGRVLEYLSYQTFFRAVQARAGTPLVLVGCFCAFRSSILVGRGGFRSRTITEDMDMNWELLLEGSRVAFVQDAVCFAKDPPTLRVFHRQVSRWTRGFLQCLAAHRRHLLGNARLTLFAWTAVAEALLTPLYGVAALWLLLTWGWRAFLLLLAIDAATTLGPILAGSRRYRVPVWFVVRNIPALYRNRVMFAVVMLESILLEWVVRRRLTVWSKGHA